MTSGRANSLTGLGPSIPADPPGLAPGLFILGSVPAVIRCWLDTDFKHNTLLYAAVCSGSRDSFLDMHLAKKLGFDDDIVISADGTRKLKVSLYLPEAVPVSTSARSGSPAPQLPSMVVDFTIIEEYDPAVNAKALQIILGSNTLRTHNADILFSTNQLTLYDEDRTKLQIPLVRPEDERTFRTLSTTTRPRQQTEDDRLATDGQLQLEKGSSVSERFPATLDSAYTTAPKGNGFSPTNHPDGGASVGRRSLEGRPQLGLTTSSRSGSRDAQTSSPTTATSRSGPSSAIWSNWRRDSIEPPKASALDWANVGKTTTSSTNYKPRDTGIKVLKTTKSMSRASSSSMLPPSTSQSRFFDEGRRREGEEGTATIGQVKRNVSGEKGKENGASTGKPRPTNPVGGASAFAWLN